jgi:hypothetical protein
MDRNVSEVKHVRKVAKHAVEIHFRSLNLSNTFTFYSIYCSDPYLIQIVKDRKTGKDLV